MTTKLKELVDALEKAGVLKMTVCAYGSGDEGTVEDAEYELPDSCDDLDLAAFDFDDLIEAAFDEKGFDYYNGNGGELQLEVNVAERTCNWSAYVRDLVMCDSESCEETV